MKNLRIGAFVLGVLAAAWPVHATVFNFATFNEVSGTKPFTFLNNGGTSASISYNSGVPVSFNFTTPTGLSTADRAATLTINTNSSFTPAVSSGALLDEAISPAVTLHLTENATGKNLLTLTFTGDLEGPAGGVNAQITGADTNSRTVAFTSDYLTFTTPGNSFGLSMAAMSTPLAVGPGGFLNSFIADLQGSFAANATQVPEPGTLGTFAVGAVVLIRRRRAGPSVE